MAIAGDRFRSDLGRPRPDQPMIEDSKILCCRRLLNLPDVYRLDPASPYHFDIEYIQSNIV